MNPDNKDTNFKSYGISFTKINNTKLPPQIPKDLSFVTQISIGDEHALIITGDQRIYVCGSNQYGQLGFSKAQHGTMIENLTLNEIKIDAEAPLVILDAACGANHSIVLGINAGKKVVCVFGHESGLGFGDLQNVEVPKPQKIPGNIEEAERVFASFNRSLVLTQTGIIYHWGEDFFGGTLDSPTEIYNFKCKLESFAVGYLHALAVASNSS